MPEIGLLLLRPEPYALSLMPYSYLNASTGSNFAAFHAGYSPKNRPTLIDVPTPSRIAHGGTLDGSFGMVRLIRTLIPTPHNTPSAPPAPVRAMASVRN